MSTAVAEKTRSWFGSDNLPSKTFTGHDVEHFSDGTATVKDIEVFRTGTFRDSMGDQATWLPEHLMQMVANFDMLKDRNIFVDVPARRDHSRSIDKVMGYIASLRTDGVKLFADIHVTEPTDVDKLVRGTYRARSLEVGMYITNDEAAFWPVVFGVAYVDLAAVEGLFNKSPDMSPDISYFSQISQGDGNMGNGNQAPAPGTGTTTAVDDRPPQTVINLNGFGTGQPTATPTPPPSPSPSPAPAPTPSPAPAPAPQPAPNTGPTGTFRINGQETTDFAAVQAHVAALEGIITTINTDARKSFVAALAKDNKIVATQAPILEAYALSLPPEGYDAWVKTYEGAQVVPLLAKHGAPAGGNPNAAADDDPIADEIAVNEEIVKGLHRAGMPDDKIKKSAAFTRLTELKTQQS